MVCKVKAIEKPKKNLKCPQKQSGANCDRESVESGDSNASDSDSSSSLNSDSDSENMEVKLIRTQGRPRGSKNKGLLIYVVIYMNVNVII